ELPLLLRQRSQIQADGRTPYATPPTVGGAPELLLDRSLLDHGEAEHTIILAVVYAREPPIANRLLHGFAAIHRQFTMLVRNDFKRDENLITEFARPGGKLLFASAKFEIHFRSLLRLLAVCTLSNDKGVNGDASAVRYEHRIDVHFGNQVAEIGSEYREPHDRVMKRCHVRRRHAATPLEDRTDPQLRGDCLRLFQGKRRKRHRTIPEDLDPYPAGRHHDVGTELRILNQAKSDLNTPGGHLRNDYVRA